MMSKSSIVKCAAVVFAAIVLFVTAYNLKDSSDNLISAGYDVKNNYYNSEAFPSLNENAYVGGDAYNFIINGTYFAGYMAIGGAKLVGAVICAVSGVLLLIKAIFIVQPPKEKGRSKDTKGVAPQGGGEAKAQPALAQRAEKASPGANTEADKAKESRNEQLGRAESEKAKRISEYWDAHKKEKTKLLAKRAEAERILNNGKNLDAQTLDRVRDFVKSIDAELTKDRPAK